MSNPGFDAGGIFGRITVFFNTINWVGVACSLALQGLFLAALLSMGVISMPGRQEKLTVLSLRAAPEPPSAARAPPKHEVKPVIQPQPKTEVIVPQPKLALQPDVSAAPVAVETPAPPAPSAVVPPKAEPPASSSGSGPVNVANLNTNLLSGSPPRYPMGSRRKREQGTVVLRLVVSEGGRVTQVAVQRSSGFPDLDDAALAAVRNWRWSPTIRDGRAVVITGLVQIPFVLREA